MTVSTGGPRRSLERLVVEGTSFMSGCGTWMNLLHSTLPSHRTTTTSCSERGVCLSPESKTCDLSVHELKEWLVYETPFPDKDGVYGTAVRAGNIVYFLPSGWHRISEFDLTDKVDRFIIGLYRFCERRSKI